MKRWIAIGLSVIMALCLLGCQNQPENTTTTIPPFATITEPSGPTQQPAKLEQSKYEQLNYLLYIPVNAKADMPLVVYLHGGSSRGNNPQLMLAQDGFPRYLISGQLGLVNAYVLIPQLGTDQTGWEKVLDTLMDMIDHVAGAYKINTQKISITGHSIGGTGVWRMAVKYPDRFSCFVPMSGNARLSEDNLNILSNANIWTFVGTADTVIDPIFTQQFMDALAPINPKGKLTVLEGYTHNQVPSAYCSSTYNIVQWMISQ